MEKYGRVLIIIFFLCVFNLGLSIYIISNISKLNIASTNTKPAVITTTSKTQTPSATMTTPPTIQSDLTLIKAEIRALRDSLEITGLITESPTPKP